jgi:replication factor A1
MECRILIIIDLEVLKQHGAREKIGNPTGLEAVIATATAAGQQPAPPVQHEAASATSFYGSKPPQPQPTSAPVGGGRGGGAARSAAGSSNATHGNVYPIEAISPYQNKWTIKARVTNKSDIKTWSNQKSEGKLFTVTFLDGTGEIRATGFNQECDSFFEILQEGQVYLVSKCRVNLAKKQFSNVNNDYELTFGRETEIELVCLPSIPYWALLTTASVQ